MNNTTNNAKLGGGAMDTIAAYANDRPQPPIMQGKPIPQEWRINLKNWDMPPYNRWSFNHCSEIIPSAVIARDEKNALFFPTAPQNLEGLTFTNSRGVKTSMQDYLEKGFVDAFLVYHKGKIIFEKYFAFTNQRSCHLMQSMGKSIVGAIGQKLKDDKILHGDMLVEKVLPELKGTAYGGATIQHLMDMRSGISFSENYDEMDDIASDCYALDAANGWKPNDGRHPKDNYSLMQTYKKLISPPGEQVVYRSTDTDVATHCFEKLTGKKIAELISEFFWRPMGAEADAAIAVDPMGYGIGCGGMSARAVDMLKFGVMMTEDGVVNGKQLLSAARVAECYDPSPYPFDKKNEEITPCGGYKNFFWIKDVAPPVIMCSGVFGQNVIMDKEKDMVIVQFATSPTYYNVDEWHDVMLLSEAISKNLA
ncbi:MAG: serine hydrolase [Hydrotalea sp.]|nr:serine hydrolase [Hydrotalea sp.]